MEEVTTQEIPVTTTDEARGETPVERSDNCQVSPGCEARASTPAERRANLVRYGLESLSYGMKLGDFANLHPATIPETLKNARAFFEAIASEIHPDETPAA